MNARQRRVALRWRVRQFEASLTEQVKIIESWFEEDRQGMMGKARAIRDARRAAMKGGDHEG